MSVDLQARRLVAAAALGTHVRRRAGACVAASAAAADLVALARRLARGIGDIERPLGVRMTPPFPGVTAGPEHLRGGLRLVLGTRIATGDGTPLGVVFTTLISGRPPLVSIAPAGAVLPRNWR